MGNHVAETQAGTATGLSSMPALKLACPKCGEPLGAELTSTLMDTSRVKFSVSPHPGELLSAENVGGVITSMAKLYDAIAKDMGHRVVSVVENIEFKDGGVTVHMLLTRSERKIKKRKDIEERGSGGSTPQLWPRGSQSKEPSK